MLKTYFNFIALQYIIVNYELIKLIFIEAILRDRRKRSGVTFAEALLYFPITTILLKILPATLESGYYSNCTFLRTLELYVNHPPIKLIYKKTLSIRKVKELAQDLQLRNDGMGFEPSWSLSTSCLPALNTRQLMEGHLPFFQHQQ